MKKHKVKKVITNQSSRKIFIIRNGQIIENLIGMIHIMGSIVEVNIYICVKMQKFGLDLKWLKNLSVIIVYYYIYLHLYSIIFTIFMLNL